MRWARPFIDEALSWLPSQEELAQTRASARHPIFSGPTHKLVVLADDNADMRNYLTHLLTGAGFIVHGFSDGEAALNAARQLKPDLILSHVMMPRLDGLRIAAAIRSAPELGETLVVLLSARAGQEASIQGRQAGADDYIVKPFSARELLARVFAAIRLAEARREILSARREEIARLLRLFDHAPAFICVLSGPEHIYEFANESYRDLIARADIVGRSIRDVLPEIADQGFLSLLDSVYHTGERFAASGAWVQLARNAYCLDFIFEPVRQPSGETTGVFVGFDVTERSRASERQATLLNELNRRVKNTLATVQSIVWQSLRSAASAEEARAAIDTRLIALVRTHDLLTVERWSGAGARDVVMQALEAFQAAAKPQITVAGADFRLKPHQALALSLALHELATNALKYGALSVPSGTVRVGWRCSAHEDVVLIWREQGGPPVQKPGRKGFGSRLLERTLEKDLGGACS